MAGAAILILAAAPLALLGFKIDTVWLVLGGGGIGLMHYLLAHLTA